jgi:VanZ like family
MTSISGNRRWSTGGLRGIAVFVWLAIMAATLWPLNPVPRNDATWLPQTNGIHFGKNGLLLSSQDFPAPAPSEAHTYSLEISLRPASETDVHTFLTFYLADHPQALELRQWGRQLLIFRRMQGPHGHISGSEIDVDHVFQRGKPVWITVTSGPRGTSVYLNGELVQSAGGFHLPENVFAGQLVLGTSPITFDPWSGDVSALALYRNELSAVQARQHYQAGIPAGLSLEDLQSAVAIYGFAEHDGSTIHNEVANAPWLMIPPHFQVPHKPLLLVPWKEITPLWIYIDDIVRNILGFVPLGIAVYLYFLRKRKSNAAMLTIFLGFATSLSIEIIQAYIPQRFSGMTDIITNTSGTALGVLLLQPRVIRMMLETWGVIEAPPQTGAAQR